MAINALIAQGVTPLGEGLAQTYDTLQRNALMQQQVNFGQSQQLRQNALQDRALSKQDQQDAAQWAYAGAQHLNQVASDPQQFSAIADQYAADPRARALGITRDKITPQSVQQLLQGTAISAGAAPVAPVIEKVDKGGSLVTADARTGKTNVLYTAPEDEKFTGEAQPMTINGKNVMAKVGSKGTVQVVPGASPYQAPAKATPGYDATGKIDPRYDKQVQAILGYRAPPLPSGRSGPSAAIMAEVYARDPTYDATSFGAKSKVINSFMAGADGKQLDAVNTSVQHLELLKDLSAALQNGDLQAVNQAKQAWYKATGKAAPTNYQTVANVAAAEVNKVAVGGPGSSEDRELSRAASQINMSPDQQIGSIDSLQGLMAGRLNSLALRYKNGTKLDNFNSLLTPETQQALARHGYQGGQAPTPSPAIPDDIAALLKKHGGK